jgi:hypothetical protein
MAASKATSEATGVLYFYSTWTRLPRLTSQGPGIVELQYLSAGPRGQAGWAMVAQPCAHLGFLPHRDDVGGGVWFEFFF